MTEKLGVFDKPVTIIGAGPGGLTLARLLQIRGVTVRLFEHDPSFSARDQGRSFDLHNDGGQKALVEAELFDEFKKFARPEGQSTKVIDMYGKVCYEDKPSPDDMSRPEIDRQVLRNMLLNSLKPNTVFWNKHVTDVKSLDNGQHKIIFKDGTTEITDLLVGADGTWSKVRPLLWNVQPLYTGVTLIETSISNAKLTSPYITELVGHGTATALGDNKGLLAQKNGDGSIRIYVALRVPENYVNDYDFRQPLAVRVKLLEVLSGWESGLLEMLNRSDDHFVPRQIYSLPLQQQWTTKSGLTVIGDAAHVMTPFAGQGANLAMLDALELADCLTSRICKDRKNLATAVKTFEDGMIKRARVFSEESFSNMNVFISKDGPRGAVEFFTQMVEAQENDK